MRTQSFRNRARELELTESTQKKSRLPLFTTAVVGFGALCVWMSSLFTSQVAPPRLVPSVAASATEGWTELVRVLDALRTQALEHRDLAALGLAIHPSGPAYVSESALINSLIEHEITVSGIEFHLLSVVQRFRRWSGSQEFVELEVVDERTAYRQSEGPEKTSTVPPRPTHKWRLLLMRETSKVPWRIWSVDSATQDLSANNRLN